VELSHQILTTRLTSQYMITPNLRF